MNLQPTLENEDILLRPLKKDDFESLYDVAKDPIIWEQHHANRFERNEFERYFTESIESKGALVVIDKVSKKMIGSSRFKRIATSNNAIEIGWSFLSRKYWGGKFNKEIKILMIDYAFEYIDNVIFYINKNNIRSQKAVEKIGGTKINGSEYQYLTNKDADILTYLITHPNQKG